jgi:hypothetical protein
MVKRFERPRQDGAFFVVSAFSYNQLLEESLDCNPSRFQLAQLVKSLGFKCYRISKKKKKKRKDYNPPRDTLIFTAG